MQGLRELEKAAWLVKEHLTPESHVSRRWCSYQQDSTQQSSAGILALWLPVAWPPGAHTIQARSGYLGGGSRQGRSPHREHFFHAPPSTLRIVSAQECLGEGSWGAGRWEPDKGASGWGAGQGMVGWREAAQRTPIRPKPSCLQGPAGLTPS